MSSCITTYSGKRIDPLDPDADEICVLDIAHALSLLCRGNGHVKYFYSVAQHCIACANEAAARGLSTVVRLACLLHDGAEAYLCDIPRPVKSAMSGYRAAEDRLLGVILTKYIGRPLSDEEYAATREIDDQMLAYEFLHLMPHGLGEPKLVTRPDYALRLPPDVEKEYLSLAEKLISALESESA